MKNKLLKKIFTKKFFMIFSVLLTTYALYNFSSSNNFYTPQEATTVTCNVETSTATNKTTLTAMTINDNISNAAIENMCSGAAFIMPNSFQTWYLTASSEQTDILNSSNSSSIEPTVSQNCVDETEENEYSNLALANVENYVNIRNAASTNSKILGKLYKGCVAEIIDSVDGEDGLWFHIQSGTVNGYIKAEYFIYGEAANAVIDEYIIKYARIDADRLNVRTEPDTTSKKVGFLNKNERVEIVEILNEWLKVQYTPYSFGYVSKDYASIWEEFNYAKSIEEELKEKEDAKALLARNKEPEITDAVTNEIPSAMEATAPDTEAINIPVSDDNPPENLIVADDGDLRTSLIQNAMQYLGNKYVHGGQSLSGGTDCSGFTCYLYAEYGYSLSRTPSGQYSSAGRNISYEEIKPGDIVCYSSSGGKCTHVALYIGDGQIIHEANSRKGVIISNVDYEPIIGIKNVID